MTSNYRRARPARNGRPTSFAVPTTRPEMKLQSKEANTAKDTLEYAYFDLDGAYFRRMETIQGKPSSVDDVLHDGKWVPYAGPDHLKPAVFGDRIPDPLGVDGTEQRPEQEPRKAAKTA